MKRLLTLVAAALLALGVTAGPAAADFVPTSTSRAICIYGDPGAGWTLRSYRTLHYGSAHVTQCWHVYELTDSAWCSQYVWNVPSPYWSAFPPMQIGTYTYICW